MTKEIDAILNDIDIQLNRIYFDFVVAAVSAWKFHEIGNQKMAIRCLKKAYQKLNQTSIEDDHPHASNIASLTNICEKLKAYLLNDSNLKGHHSSIAAIDFNQS